MVDIDMGKNWDELEDVPFEYNDYIVFRSLLNGFTICDRYFCQGFMQGIYDRPLLCKSGYITADPMAVPPDAYKWVTKELDHKWRGSQLKELGLLEYITVIEVRTEQPHDIESVSADGMTGFKIFDAPKYLYYVYAISDKGREAAQQILSQQHNQG